MKEVTIKVEDDMVAKLKSGEMKIALLPKDELENVEGGSTVIIYNTAAAAAAAAAVGQEGDQ